MFRLSKFFTSVVSWFSDNYLLFFHFQERDEFNAIDGKVREVKIDQDGSSVFFFMPRLCLTKRSLRVRPVCSVYCEGKSCLCLKIVYS